MHLAISWLFLILAILLEVGGTTAMKLSEGFSRLWPTVFIFIFYSLSLIGLVLALRRIDVSIAYAVWSGVGTAVIAAIGIFWFQETITTFKLVSLGLIIAGVVGLNLGGGSH